MINRYVSLSLSVLLASSCAVGPDYKQPEFFSDKDIAASLKLRNKTTQIKQDWYKEFNDPILNKLVEQGLT